MDAPDSARERGPHVLTLLEETVQRGVQGVEVTIPGTSPGDGRMRLVFTMGDEWLIAVWLTHTRQIELYSQQRRFGW